MIRMGCKSLLSLILFFFLSTFAWAQTATYHLHGDGGVFQIKSQNPSATITSVQSAELKGLTGEFLVQDFPTSGFEPNGTGTIPAGSTVTYTLWMKKTATAGVIFPRAKLFLNSATGALFCTVTGTTALTTTLTEYTLMCTTTAAIVMISPKQFYLWVGVNITTGSGNTRVKAEIDLGGTLNGADDSRVQIPLPPIAIISSLSPSSGAIGTVVTINGANFGDSQGLGKVTFNGVAATPSSWSDTAIVAPVPTGATTGPVIVTTSPIPSNGVTFTVGSAPTTGSVFGTITRATDGTPISGGLVDALQLGAVTGSANTGANGTYSITGLAAGTYDIRISSNGYATTQRTGVSVTAGGNTIVNAALTAAPTISGVSPTSGLIGASVTISGSNFGATQGTSTVTFNGVSAAASSWSNTSVIAPVPTGAATGPIVVTVSGAASNAVTFTVVTTGGISGKVTQSDGVTAIAGASIKTYQGTTLINTTTTNASGDYVVAALNPATYVVEASATGFVTKSQTGVTVAAGATTSVNLSLSVPPAPISYVYDGAGRLIAAIDPAGETATYTYDAVGNLLSISRHSSTVVSIIEFTPNAGAATTSVTIYGTGFSTTASQNTVSFNGTTANVSSSTSTQIVTIVPSGATTGPITVTTAVGSASSGASFVVTMSAGAPTITGFSPTTGLAGTPVTVNGANFDPTLGNTKLSFNVTYSTTDSMTATTISTTVPARATSGHVSVATPSGRTVSSGDFFVPPPNHAVADVAFTARIAFGSTTTVTFNALNKIALLIFDGAPGQVMNFKISNPTIASYDYVVYTPVGLVLKYGSNAGTADLFAGPTPLPSTGTYTIGLFAGDHTGQMTLTLYDASPITGSITAGGAPVTVTTTAPAQKIKLTFNGTTGQRVSLNLTNLSYSTSLFVIDKPDGTTLLSQSVNAPATFIDTQTLPATGSYTIHIYLSATTTGSATFTLYNVPADASGSITPGGSSSSVTTTTPGQNANLMLNDTGGHPVKLTVTNLTIGGSTVLKILNPDGTTLFSTSIAASGSVIESPTLPANGLYTIAIDPQGTNIGSITLTVSDLPADVTGTITMNGPPILVTLGVPEQKARLSLTPGRMSLLLDNITITQSSVSLYDPSGVVLWTFAVSPTTFFLEPYTTTSPGTYTLVIDPVGAYTGSMTVSAYNIPPDVSGTIVAGGSPVTVSITAPGQNAAITFSGTAGQQISLNLSSVTITGSNVSIINPDGSTLTSLTGVGTSGAFIDAKTLPATGTYRIFIDPNIAYTGSVTLTLYNVVDVIGTVTVGGAIVNVTTTTPGQNALLTFNGSANQKVTVQLSSNIMGSVTVSLLKSDRAAGS
jgi:YD repeat-containing protein